MEEPVELLKVSYQQIGVSHVLMFVINGQEQLPILVPKCNEFELASCIQKMVNVIADPIGPCINEIPM